MELQSQDIPRFLSPLVGQLKELSFNRQSVIYFLLRNEELLYIGKSIQLPARIEAHASTKRFNRVLYFETPPTELAAIESAFIQHFRPPLNKAGMPWDGWEHIMRSYGFEPMPVKIGEIYG